MRKLSDLIREEPVAITGLVTAAVNVAMATGAHFSADFVASVNVLVGAAFMTLRWLVVSPATADAMADDAHIDGYHAAIADVKSLDVPKKRRVVGGSKTG